MHRWAVALDMVQNFMESQSISPRNQISYRRQTYNLFWKTVELKSTVLVRENFEMIHAADWLIMHGHSNAYAPDDCSR